MLASINEEISVAELHEQECPSLVAAIAIPVSTVICTPPPFGLPLPYCNTYTTYNFPESVYPPASCCGSCSIQASRVQVNYWAPEADSTGTAATTQAPETPYTLVSDGYTFTSPSVYVVFMDLYAQGDCTYYEGGQIGNNISDATIAYDPETLSTAECDQFGNSELLGYKAINYSSWYNPLPNSVVETQTGCQLLATESIDPAGTDLVASPMFMMPQGLSSLEPIWSSYGCQANGRGPAFDPPRVLTKTGALAPGIQHPTSQSATATPAAQLSPPIVTPTMANYAQPTLEASTPEPKSVGAEPKAGGPVPQTAVSDQRTTPTSQDVGPPDDDPGAIAIGANLRTEKYSASVEVAGQPLVNSDPTTQGLGPGPSQNMGEGLPNTPPIAVARPEPTPNQGFTVGNEVITANRASRYVVNGQTITPGAPVVIISGTPISLGPSAIHVVIGTSTIPLGELKSSTLPSFTIGNKVITADSASQYVVDGQALAPGAPAITVSGTPISLAPSEAYVAVGSTTIPLQNGNALFPPTIVINGEVITANSASDFVVGGQTLTPGAPAVTIQGIPVSVPADVLPFITVGSHTYPYAFNSAGDIIIASQTVVPGGVPITLSGETISEASDRSDLVLASGGVVKTEGLAQLIVGALGKTAVSTGNVGGNTSFNGQTFTGGASKKTGMDLFGLAVTIALLIAFDQGTS